MFIRQAGFRFRSSFDGSLGAKIATGRWADLPSLRAASPSLSSRFGTREVLFRLLTKHFEIFHQILCGEAFAIVVAGDEGREPIIAMRCRERPHVASALGSTPR